ncbi:MAG: hypothetical protein RBR42_05045 [Desulfomicrobium sp.]|nr:hypothetical protein [Desulfomicrobium sp.]
MQTFTDEYLASEVTTERMIRATKDVESMGTFPHDWKSRLIELRAYIVTCQECTQGQDDLYYSKLKAYSKEFENSVMMARNAASDEGAPLFLSVHLERR